MINNKPKLKYIVVLLFLSLFVASNGTQARIEVEKMIPEQLLENAPELFKLQFITKTMPPHYTPKSPGHYTRDDWRAAIDATWGNDITQETKYNKFNYYWNKVDTRYGCFQNLDLDWDSLGNVYRTELSDSVVSDGRFGAMISHSARSIREPHSFAYSNEIASTYPYPGVPLFHVGAWGDNSRFGAGLTPQPDSTLLVYKAVDDHPLGLVPGDKVLGYDGRLWIDLYPELIDAELPLTGLWWGGSPSSYTHSMMMAAGMNWHLFDTIDIIKYDSGDTVHLGTEPLNDLSEFFWATEQVTNYGVNPPDIIKGEILSDGFIPGTDIGYIYCLGWFGNNIQEIMQQWFYTLGNMTTVFQTSGLIIDLRTNFGGYVNAITPGLEILFDNDLDCIRMHERNMDGDHFDMIASVSVPHDIFKLNGEPSAHYYKPIAVLIGPGAVSGGDFTPMWLSYLPHAKLFGKPTSTAYNTYNQYGVPPITFQVAEFVAYNISPPAHYMTHAEFPSEEYYPWANFEDIWLTPDMVAAGRDDVVEAAIAWIETQMTDIDDETDKLLPENYELKQNYPNPFNSSTSIEFFLPTRQQLELTLFNLAGQVVKKLVEEELTAGYHTVRWDGTDNSGGEVATGVYFYRLQSDDYENVKKMIYLK